MVLSTHCVCVCVCARVRLCIGTNLNTVTFSGTLEKIKRPKTSFKQSEIFNHYLYSAWGYLMASTKTNTSSAPHSLGTQHCLTVGIKLCSALPRFSLLFAGLGCMCSVNTPSLLGLARQYSILRSLPLTSHLLFPTLYSLPGAAQLKVLSEI